MKNHKYIEKFLFLIKKLENFIKNKASIDIGKQYFKLTKGAVLNLTKNNKQLTTKETDISYTLKQDHIFELMKLEVYKEKEEE